MQTPAAQQPVGQLAALHLELPEDIRASVPPLFCFAGADRPQAVAQASNAIVVRNNRTQLPRFMKTPPAGTKDETVLDQIMVESRGRV